MLLANWLARQTLLKAVGHVNRFARQTCAGTNQVRFAPLDQNIDPAIIGFGVDNWDGYVADRQRVLDFMKERKPSNPVVITGDAHVHSVRNVPPSFENFEGDPVATEFIGSSISTDGDRTSPTTFGGDPQNPQRLFQCDKRGYVSVEVTPENWTADFRVLDTVRSPTYSATSEAVFAVEDGKPGAVRV